MNDITPKEASEILRHYTNLGYGIVIEGDDVSKIVQALSLARKALASGGDLISREALQGEYKTACNVLLSLEQIVRSSDGWEDSAVEAVHNAVQTAIKCMHDRPKGEWIHYLGCGIGKAVCSECGQVGETKKYCGNCGVRMKGDKE